MPVLKPKKEQPIIVYLINNYKIKEKRYKCKYCSASFSHVENYELHYKHSHKESQSCSFFGICKLSPLE